MIPSWTQIQVEAMPKVEVHLSLSLYIVAFVRLMHSTPLHERRRRRIASFRSLRFVHGRQKNDSDVATRINYCVASFSVGVNLYVIPKRTLRKLGGS
jgi:hypothetical protein